MISHKCTVRHDPDNGQYGDCWRASIASILNCGNIEDVPHFFHDGATGEVGFSRIERWLNFKGFALFRLIYDGSQPFQDVLNSMYFTNPNTYYLIMGECDGNPHVVTGLNDRIVHDPAWLERPMTGPIDPGFWVVFTLIPGLMKS